MCYIVYSNLNNESGSYVIDCLDLESWGKKPTPQWFCFVSVVLFLAHACMDTSYDALAFEKWDLCYCVSHTNVAEKLGRQSRSDLFRSLLRLILLLILISFLSFSHGELGAHPEIQRTKNNLLGSLVSISAWNMTPEPHWTHYSKCS